MIHLVRHGHAGSKHAWKDDDRLRPISDRGRLQTEGIRDVLGAPGTVTAIVSSPLLRCIQTMEPLAEMLELEIQTRDWLIAGVEARDVERRIRKLDPGTVLCSHGEVIGPLIERLVAEGIPLDGPLSWPKGSIWHLKRKKRRIVSGRFVHPAATDD